MTLYAFKSATWFLLLLWTSQVSATPLRGSFRQSRLRKRHLAMDKFTWSPTQSPTNTATQSPTNTATQSPTTTPTQIPTSMPLTATPTTSPTSPPVKMPTSQPSLVAGPTALTPPTPAMAPPGTSAPAVSKPTSPTNAALFRVPLLDFQLDYVGEDASIQQVTESYLAENMDFSDLVGVELFDGSRRQLQQQDSNTKSFSGNAIFSDQPVPSIQAVQESQTVALDNIGALQQAFDDANANIEVQQVVIPDTQTPSHSSSPWNVGLIAGVAVAAVVVLLLVVYVGYRKFRPSNDKSVGAVRSTIRSSVVEQETAFVKYTPDDFEPTKGSVDVKELPKDMEDAASLDMDEYSLSAASADFSIKTKDTEQRKQSLLKKLALYQKTEKKSSTKEVAMPAALYVPGASRSTNTVSSVYTTTSIDMPRAPTPTKLSAAAAAATSLLQVGNYDDEEEEGEEVEVDLLPPLSDSSGSPPRMTQQGLSPRVVSPQAQKPQIVRGRWREQQRLPPQVVSSHDFASTTWQHPPVTIKAAQQKTYSDGPSDEMNFEMEQDLTNFSVPPAVVSPEPPSPPRIVRDRKSPPPPPPPKPVTQQKDEGSYAGSHHGSYDGSYTSSGPEVSEDLDGLTDFLREKKEAKRAERKARKSRAR